MIRAGSRTVSFLAHPLNVRVLRMHVDGPLRPGQLEKTIGWAATSSLRTAVAKLCERGVLARIELDDSAKSVATELTDAGRELLPVVDSLERWLAEAPDGPIALGDPAAQGVLTVLSAGWDATMIRALAERPLTLAELNDEIPALGYPALKHRLAKLRSTRLVTPIGSGRATAYEASEWLSRAIAPLAISARWELLHDAGAEAISSVEVEAAFLLALPLVELPGDPSGECALAVLLEGTNGSEREVAGVLVEVQAGRVSFCRAGPAPDPPTWAVGTPQAWLETFIDARADRLRVSGVRPRLAKALVEGVRAAIFEL